MLAEIMNLMIFTAKAIAIVGLVSITLFIVRTTWILIARSSGTYNPEHYHLWPRFPWRVFAKPVIRLIEAFQDSKLGGIQKTQWASFSQRLLLMFKPGQLFVGRLAVIVEIPKIKKPLLIPMLMPVGIPTSLHALIIAGAGAGKSSTLVSMIALHRGNAFVVDPAGELAFSLLKRCGKGGNEIRGKSRTALVLDPRARVKGTDSASWNVFDEISRVQTARGVNAVPSFVKKIVRALIPASERDTNQALTDTARKFVVGLILHVHSSQTMVNKSLIYVSQLLNRAAWTGSEPGEEKDASGIFASYRQSMDCLLAEMENNDSFGGAIKPEIADVKDLLREGRHGDRLISARTQLDWLTDPQMKAVSMRSDFSMADLRRGDLSLFVCAPATEIEGALCGWFRLLTTVAMEEFEHESSRVSENTTLFVIDEMPSLGYLDAIDKAGPLMRKAGLQLIGVTQDLQRLRKAYPGSDEGFISNMGVTLWMAPGPADAMYLEGLLGKQTAGADHGPGSDRALASAEQLRSILAAKEGNSRNNVLVRPRTGRAMILRTPHYFNELPVYYYESPSDKPETSGRKATRSGLMSGLNGTEGKAPSEICGIPGKLAINAFGRSELLRENPDADREKSFYEAHVWEVTAACLTSDGRYLVLGERTNQNVYHITAYDPHSLQVIASIDLGKTSRVLALTAIPDSILLIASLTNGLAKVDIAQCSVRKIVTPSVGPSFWAQRSGGISKASAKVIEAALKFSDKPVMEAMHCSVVGISRSKSSALIALSWDDRPVGICTVGLSSNVVECKPKLIVDANEIHPSLVAYDAQLALFVIGDRRGFFWGYSTETYSELWAVRLKFGIYGLDFCETTSRLAMLKVDGEILFCNTKNGTLESSVFKPNQKIEGSRYVKFFAKGTRLLTLFGSKPYGVVWDVVAQQQLGTLEHEFGEFCPRSYNDIHHSLVAIFVPQRKGVVVSVSDPDGFKAAKLINLSRYWPD